MSRTQENLQEAFAGESQARNKYIYYAKIARKEGLHYVADIFEETAKNEEQHAKDNIKLLKTLYDTKSNLRDAIAGEDYEATTMYPKFAQIAKDEGHQKAAIFFSQVAKVEADHRDRYQKLLNLLESDSLYTRDGPITWKCIKCGWSLKGTKPPKTCPACQHPAHYFTPSDF